MKRRNFISASALASTALAVPSFLTAFPNKDRLKSRGGKILIVVQLSGGNDGLNTVIPFEDDLYYQNRPSLGIAKGEVLRLNQELGLNPAMTSLRALYEEGYVSILNSVGYPNPDRSHFRSMDIWHTASDSSEYLSTGWLGRYLDSNCMGCEKPYHALEIDDSLSLSLKGLEQSGFAMRNPAQLNRTAGNKLLKAIAKQQAPSNDAVAYLYKTMVDTQSSAAYLFEQSKAHRSIVEYPKTGFGKNLKQIAELVTADTDTKIYYVSLTGFDTHVNQKNVQSRLLKQYAEGMKALVQDLKKNNLFEDTLILTFSEFGRRVRQNASNGTDHGTANNLFLIGGRLKKAGFYNEAPDLRHLEKGDLQYEIDFRKVYATVLDRWLEADAKAILGTGFSPMPLL